MLCQSLLFGEGCVTTRARVPVDQDCNHSSPVTQGYQLITLDFISLSEEPPNKESACFPLNRFSHKKVLQNLCPPLKFSLLFQLQKRGTCLLNDLTSVSSVFQMQLSSCNHLQSLTLNAKLVLVKAETKNDLFFCSMFAQHLL